MRFEWKEKKGPVMARFNFDSDVAPPWTQVFIELAVRGILRVHQDYLGWDIDQIVIGTPNLSRINSGSGVALADELTVCAAIAQSFISSRYASGIWFDATDGSGGEHHFYKLTREIGYGNNDRVDFVCVRIHETRKYGPSLIEAKRVRVEPTHLESTEHGPGASNRSGISIDISKLRDNIGSRPTTESDRGLILLWNIVDGARIETEGPVEYLQGFLDDRGLPDDELRVWQMRCVPLTSDQVEEARHSLKGLSVSKWLWVALVEVTPIVDGDEKDIPSGNS